MLTPNPAQFDDGIRESHARAFLAMAAIALAVGCVIYLTVLRVAVPEQTLRTIGPASLLFIVAFALLCYRRGQTRTGLLALGIGVWVEITVMAVITGGIRAPALYLYPVIILMAGWLLGLRYAYLFAGGALAACIGLGAAEWLGWLPAVSNRSSLVLVVQCGAILFTTLIVKRVVESHRVRLQEVQRLGANLGERIEDLARSETSYRDLFNTVREAIYIQDRDGCFLDVNEAATRLYGYPREAFIGRSPEFVSAPGLNDLAAVGESVARALAGEPQRFEFWGLRADGSRFLKDVRLVRGHWFDKEVIIATAEDITGRREAERALQESRARLAEAQRIGHVGSWTIDLADGTMNWSEELRRIFALEQRDAPPSLEALLGRVLPQDEPRLREALLGLAAGPRSGEHKFRIRPPDGGEKTLHMRRETSIDELGKPRRALGTVQDISEQELAHAEIERFNAVLEQRVAARTHELTAANRELESFAYSISHDLRSPLRGIDGFSHLLLEQYQDRLDAQGRDYLARVRAAAQRMGALIDDILELSRVTRQEMRRERVDLSALAAEVTEELAQGLKEGAPELQIAPGCVAMGDPQLLRLLLQNLLDNAWKYSSPAAEPKIEFGRELSEGKEVFFVKDNGVGFDPEFGERLFAPFQRLHKPGEFEGNGIGLATVARVARRHGGKVWARSVPGVETEFRFTLGGEGESAQ